MTKIAIQPNAAGTGTFTIEAPNSNSNRTLTLPDAAGVLNTSGAANEVPAGTASAPAIFPTGDTNTGVFFPAADVLGLTTNGSERARLDASGNLLVGTTATNNWVESATTTGLKAEPNGTLVVSRSGFAALLVKRTTASTGDLVQFAYGTSVIGTIGTNGSGTIYNTTSDRRLKENIEPITDGTAKLLAMNPVTHTWIADPDAPAVHGFIAQEMIDIVPEAVSGTPDGEGMMSMDYGRITPILVAALQDALREVDLLKARIAKLEVQ